MKKKLIVAAISSALVAPSAFAAQDDLGMNYTSAAEGFYGSIRAIYQSGAGKKDSGSGFDDATSRLGVRGTNDLGGGLEGYYQVEFDVGENNGDNVVNRLRLVGLRGGFGEIEVGSIWDDTYNFVTSMSDKSPNNSGNYAPYFRIGDSLQYRTPDLNGFQGSARFTMEAESEIDDEETLNDDDDETNFVKDDNDLDEWALSAKYAFQGFTVAGFYQQTADGLAEIDPSDGSAGSGRGGNVGMGGTGGTGGMNFAGKKKDDLVFWALGMSYGQDNWNVGGWYGEKDARKVMDGANGARVSSGTNNNGQDGYLADDAEEIISVGASIDVDKVTLYGVYEQKENIGGVDGVESDYANVGVLYRLGSNTNAWIEYWGHDDDTETDEEDRVIVGLRHNF